MLDLSAAAAQIAGLADELSSRHRELPARRARALAQLRLTAEGPLPSLSVPAAGMVAIPENERLDSRFPAGPLPAEVTVLAVDGSQIEPDFHEPVGCYLINTGWCVFRLDSDAESKAVMASHPSVRIPGDPAADHDSSAESSTRPEARTTEVERMVAEVSRLRDLLQEAPPDRATVALVDGPLVAYWVLGLLDPPAREAAVTAYRQLFDLARARRVALAGYISRTRSSEVTHLLRYCLCPFVAASGALCAACQADFPRRGAGPEPCYAGIDGVIDRHLFEDLLAPGDRSARFRSPGAGPRELADAGHGLRFFYLRLEQDLARVEVPQWVAADAALIATLQAVLTDQAGLGSGYPLALCEAHEQAVVRAADRTAFHEMVLSACARQRYFPDMSPKLRAKRQPVG
jgi:hypothetical protein